MTETAATVPVLVLSTVAPEPRHVVVDDQFFLLRHVDRLPLALSVEHERLRLRAQLMWKDEMTADEEAQLEAILEKLTAIALDAPAEVLARFTAAQRMSVVTAFWHAPTSAPAGAKPARKRGKRND